MSKWNIISSTNLANVRLDPEFYKKELTDMDDKIEQLGSFRLGDLIQELTDYTANGSFASLKYNVNVSDEKNFAKWIRIQNLDTNNYMNNIRYVTEHSYNFLKKSKLFGGELLISKTGEYLGRAYLFNPNEENYYTLADNIFLLRLKDSSYNGYVFSFINSNLGRKLLLRWSQGTGQPTIIKDSLRSIRLPVIDNELKSYLNSSILKYYELQKQSQDFYQQATKLLDKELKLNTIKFKKTRSHTANFSEVISNNRADAEYYQVQFRQIEQHLKSLSTIALGTICSFVKGYEVGTKLYREKGPTFIRVSNFTKNGFSFGNSDKHISNTTYSFFKAYKPDAGDILLTKDGTVGMCYVVDEEVEGIISSGIVNLTLLDETIPKEYLALVINSKICQMQANRDCSGALISHWKPQDIRKMKIPILKDSIMKELSEMIIKSKQALKQSKHLLEQAKSRVEQLIEEAAR